MNINFNIPETITIVQKFVGYTLDEREFTIYAEWDLDNGWFVHGVMFNDMNEESEKEIDEITNYFYKNINKNDNKTS